MLPYYATLDNARTRTQYCAQKSSDVNDQPYMHGWSKKYGCYYSKL